MGIFSKIQKFLKEVLLEIKKVNWPTRKETVRYTLIVIGISVGVAIYLGGLDFIFKELLNKFIL
jgi:preprotein translocase subunit SecE